MDIQDYRGTLAERLADARETANAARERQYDPKPHVEMEFAKNLAERCEKLLMIPGLATRIEAYEEDGHSREEIAIRLTDDFAEGRIGEYDSKDEMVDAAIRVAVALLTEGVVAAPIDGIGEITIDQNDDGSDFIRIPYYGPIRSAGGTGQALSILVADYIRQKLGIGKFQPRSDEVERYVEEMHLYDREVSLQFLPKDDEIRYIVKNCSVMIDGVQTTKNEVEGYRDLERIEGNRARGGMCLVLGEGVAQKAPKIQRYTAEMQIEGWGWLNELSTVTSASEDDSEEAEEESAAEQDADPQEVDFTFTGTYDGDNEALKPKTKFLSDLIAGRPVFAGASEKGGFRLRYGRSRTTGLAACGYSPATMVIFDEFISTGTQLKTERPGKAAGVAAVDSIEGPTVRLANGEMRRIDDVEEAERVLGAVTEIIDVGEVAVPYGEFLENNHPLLPSSYVHEWWVQEYEEADESNSADDIDVDTLTAAEAFDLAETYDIPLHPKYTYLWDDVTLEQYEALAEAVEIGMTGTGHDAIEYVSGFHKETLEWLLVPHRYDEDHNRLYFEDTDVAEVLTRCCTTESDAKTVRERVIDAAGVTVRERAPVRIGARMGRPEKSERRERKAHALFPIGNAGGNLRDIEAASQHLSDADDTTYFGEQRLERPDPNPDKKQEGLIYTSLAKRKCPSCEVQSWSPRCPDCDERTVPVFECSSCGMTGEDGESCPRCDRDFVAHGRQPIDVKRALATAFNTLGERPSSYDRLKGMKGLASSSKIPEPLEKGVLRAKYDLRVFRDGTTRWDMMDIPLTAFCANDIGVDVETLHELGYETTLDGEPLTKPDQLTELYPQDLILATGAGEYMLKISKFIDELLVKYYDQEPYYNAETADDLIGELILGLAPHTSAGVLGRIIGFNPASANFASPFYHAGKRRNCFCPETEIALYDEDGGTTTIEQLVDRAFTHNEIQVDAVGTKFVELETPIPVPSVTETGDRVTQHITHFQRSPAPDSMVEITATDGTTIRVTPDHDMLVREGETLVERAAHEVSIGDELLPSTYLSQSTRLTDATVETVTAVEMVESDSRYVYNLTVDETHTLFADGFAVKQCDGDEDAVMLLMDGLLNFSKEYLPSARGKRTMDAPLVVSTVLDPLEVDDEAHNVDIVSRYPKEFYEATYQFPGPKEVDIAIAEDITDTGMGFNHTLETSLIHSGPKQSAYKSIQGMDNKTDAQLKIARITRAVDEDSVALKVIEKHYMPDIIGNLSAFARQSVRCPKCNEKYRRAPLLSECTGCGVKNSIILTVHEGSVKKYIDIVTRLSDEYDVGEYTRQRITALSERIDSLFEDDHNKQTDLGRFF